MTQYFMELYNTSNPQLFDLFKEIFQRARNKMESLCGKRFREQNIPTELYAMQKYY